MVSRAASQPFPIRALLIDISGTLLVGSSPTPGAVQAFTKLRAARIPFRLCSNTSKESGDAVHARMRAAGLDVRRDELWTSIGALKAVLKESGIKRPYMLLSQSALEECGDGSGAKDGLDTSAPVPSASPDSLPHDAVVVGLAPALLDYAHLNTAFRILVGENRPRDAHVRDAETTEARVKLRPRPPLIALHKARYLEASDYALSLGPGPFVRALEDAAQTSAVVVGKPTRAFFETVLRDLDREVGLGNVSPSLSDVLHGDDRQQSYVRLWPGTAIIGDDVEADLGDGAVELGLWRVLVRTGKYRPGDERRTKGLPPDQMCASFAEFVEMLPKYRYMSESL